MEIDIVLKFHIFHWDFDACGDFNAVVQCLCKVSIKGLKAARLNYALSERAHM